MKKILVIFFLFVCLAGRAATYYIATAANGGSNSNNGSIGNPWLTLTYACAHATVSGDIIHVNAGTFNETAQCVLAVGVSIEGTVGLSIISTTYAGESGSILIASGTQGTNGNQSISYLYMDGNSLTAHIAIEVNARSNVKIHHVNMVNFLSWGVIFNGLTYFGASMPTTYATGNEIYNCTITNCAGYGGGYGHGNLAVGGQQGFLCHDNVITQTSRGGAGSHGWCWKYYSDGYNKDVKIYNNTFDKPAYNGDWDFAMEFCMWEQGGIEIYNNTIIGSINIGARRKGDYSYSMYIHNNTIGKTTRTSAREAGIVCENIAEDLIIRYNYFKNVSHGIGMHGGDVGDHATRVYVQYNIFDQMGNANECWGLYFYNGSGNGQESYIYFENNVFTAWASHGGLGIGLALPPTEHGSYWYVRNNIFVGFNYAYMTAYGSGTMDYLYSQNNIVYNCGNNGSPLWESPYSPTNFTNTGNLTSNPLFVSTNIDWRLQAGSPARDAGVNVGLTLDYAGGTVGASPDIGAYEYDSESVIYVTGISLWGTGGATTIGTNKGTLQLLTKVLPVNATDTAKVWSIIDGTGHATISSSGLVTASTNGTVTATATAHDGSNVYDDLILTLSNQSYASVVTYYMIKGKRVQYKGKTLIKR